MALSLQACTEYQVSINGQCVECSNILYGCRQCAFSTVTYDSNSIQGLQCTECDFGLYLLSFSNTTSADTSTNILNMCIPKCEDFGYNYVSNLNSRRCEYCGPWCTNCNPIYGCTSCYRENYGSYLTTSNYQLSFPYSTYQQPSTNFKTCQNCSTITGTKNRCDSCSSYTTSYCDSCYGYVYNNSKSTDTTGCTLCTNSTLSNCLQCNSTNSAKCATCDNGYYLTTSTSTCSKCTLSSGCQRCNSTQCLECSSEYFYNSSTKACIGCTQRSKSASLYSYIDYRCSQCSYTDSSKSATESCSYCDIGYQNSTLDSTLSTSTCQLKCGTHQYPYVQYGTASNVSLNENVINSTICKECPDSCTKCIGSNSLTQCTECPAGYYLSITDTLRQSGTCVTKTTSSSTPVFTLYVSNLATDYARTFSFRTGDYSTPFVDLTDALTKAKELAAQYTNTVQIYIYLFSGTHYILRNRTDASEIYTPQSYYDPYNLNYELYIQPYYCTVATSTTTSGCGSAATIINKRRDGFVLDVPVKLYMKSITINSIDSILYPTLSCLSERRQCCQISNSAVSNVLSTDTFLCSQAFTNLSLSQNCYINQPRTMFRMRLNNQSQITEPNQLILDSCEISNIFYDMNSLVNYTAYGGSVTFLNTKFSYISICGALVKNYYSNLPLSNLNYITNTNYLTSNQIKFIEKMRTIQQSFIDSNYYTYYASVNPFTCTQCYSLTIKGCTFQNIPFGYSNQASLNLVSNSNGLRYQGSIVNLDSFKGDVRIQDSYFYDNIFPYDSCDSIITSMSDSPTASSSTNNFNQLYNADSSYNLYQIKSLIQIKNHGYGLYMYNNNFTNNTGLKGIVNIELAEQTSYPLIVYGNTFIQNSAVIDVNVLNIRKRNSQNLLGTSYTSASQLICGGIEIRKNNFTNNIGCYAGTNAAIWVYCFDNTASQSSSIVKYVTSYDSQYFIGDSGSTSLLTFDSSAISYTTYSDTYTPYSSTATTTTSQTFTVSLQKLVFQQNTFLSNHPANYSSVLLIEGFPLVDFYNDTYQSNANYFNNTFQTYSAIYPIQSSKTSPAKYTSISQSTLQGYSFKARSVVTVVRTLVMNVQQTFFVNNYISDSNTTTTSGITRSNGLLLVDFCGTLIINEGTTFSNNQGITGISYYTTNSLLSTDVQKGFKTYLIAYKRCSFNYLTLTNVTFWNNYGYYDSSLSTIEYPYLFKVNQTYVSSSQTFTFTLNSIKNNYFSYGYGMIYFDVPKLSMSSNSFTDNGVKNDVTNNGLLIIKTSIDSSKTLYNNTFTNFYTYGQALIYIETISSTVSTIQPSINLTANTFTNIYSANSPSIVQISGISSTLNVNYQPYIQFYLCTISYSYSTSAYGLIQLMENTMTVAKYQPVINITQSTFQHIESGNVIQLNAQAIVSSANSTQTLLIYSSTFNNITGNGVQIYGSKFTSSLHTTYGLDIYNTSFTDFYSGNAFNIQSLEFATTYNTYLNIAFDSVSYKNIYSGSSLYLYSVKVTSTQEYQQNISFYNITFYNITNSGFIIGDSSLSASSTISRNLTIKSCTFEQMAFRSIQMGTSSSGICQSDYNHITTLIDNTFQSNQANGATIYFDTRSLTCSGQYNETLYMKNVTFNATKSTYGSITYKSQSITSSKDLIRNFQITNSTFYNLDQGSCLYFEAIILQSSQAITDYMAIDTSTLNIIKSGYGIYQSSFTATSTLAFTQTYILTSLVLSNFDSGSAISIGSQTITSSASYTGTVTMTSLSCSNITGSCITFGTQAITSSTTKSFTLTTQSTTQFQNITGSAITFGDSAISSTSSSVTSNFNFYENTLFYNISGNAIQFGSKTKSSSGDNTVNIYVVNSNFTQISSSAIYLSQISYYKSNGISRNFTVTGSTFKTITGSVLYVDSFTGNSSTSVDLILNLLNSTIQSITDKAIYHGAISLNVTTDLSQEVNFQNMTILSLSSSALEYDAIYLNTTGKVQQTYYLYNSTFTTIAGNAIKFDQQIINSTGAINQTFDLNKVTFSGISQSAIYYILKNITSYSTYIQLLSVQSSTFSTISQYGIYLPQINATASSSYNETSYIYDTKFSTIQKYGIAQNQIDATSTGTFTQIFQLQSATFSAITNSGLYIASQSISSKSTYTFQAIIDSSTFDSSTNNSYHSEDQTITSASAALHRIQIYSSTFSSLAGHGIWKEKTVMNSGSTLTKALEMSGTTFQNCQGVHLRFGSSSLTSTGYLNKTIWIYNTQFLSNTVSEGLYHDSLTTSSSDETLIWFYFQKFTATSMYSSPLYFNTISLTGTKSVTLTYLFDQNTITSVTTGPAVSLQEIAVTTSASFINTYTITSNTISTISAGTFIRFLSKTITASASYTETITFTSNAISSVNNNGVNTGTNTITCGSDYTYTATFQDIKFSDINGNGIRLGPLVANSGGKYTMSVTVKNIYFTDVDYSGLQINTTDVTSVGKLTESIAISYIYIDGQTYGSGIILAVRSLDSGSNDLSSSFNLQHSQIKNLDTGSGVHFSTQTYSGQDVSLTTYVSNITVSDISTGSGFEMSKNTMFSSGTQTQSVTFTSSSFSYINSETGASIYINTDSCESESTITNSISITSITFDDIVKGAAIVVRDYNNTASGQYSHTVKLQSNTITDISSGVAIRIIKDLLTSNAYSATYEIKSNTISSITPHDDIDSAVTLQESFIDCTTYSISQTVSSNTFKTIQNGPSLYIMNNEITNSGAYSASITLSSNTFSSLKAADNSSIAIVQKSITSSGDFTSTIALSGSTLSSISTGSALLLNNSDITTNGKYTHTVTVTSCTVSSISTDKEAAIILLEYAIYTASTYTSTLTFTSTTFSSNYGSAITSSVYVDATNSQKTEFKSCKFQNNEGSITNEMHFKEIAKVTLDSCTWTSNNNNENKAQVIYKQDLDYYLEIKDSTFSCTESYDVYNVLQLSVSYLYNRVSLFVLQVEQSDSVTSPSNYFDSNKYTGCNEVYKGAVFNIQNGAKVYDYGSSYTINSAVYGGVVYISGYGSEFEMNTPQKYVSKNVGYQGAVIYARESAYVEVSSASFTSNKAVEGGIAYITDGVELLMATDITIKATTMYKRGIIMALGGSFFNITDCTVQLNTAYQESVFIYASNVKFNVFNSGSSYNGITSTNVISYIADCLIEKNEVLYGGKLITIQDGNLNINNTKIENNYIYYDTEGIFAASANLWISYTTFKEDKRVSYYTTFDNKFLGDMNGAYVSIGRNSSVYINNTIFYQGRGVNGGCISIQGSSQTQINNATFYSCSANIGGGIYAVNYDALVIMNSKFYQNIAFRGIGQNIYSQNSKTNLTLKKNTFYSYHNSIFYRDGKYLYMEQNMFDAESLRVASVPFQEYAGGLYVINTMKINMLNNTFQNLNSSSGGAIYTSIDMNYKNLYSSIISYTFKYLYIYNCRAASNGGAIFFKNSKSITMEDSIIKSNVASNMGGAIYFECYESWSDVCSLSIQNTTISQNTALIGGGIRWNWRKVTLGSNNDISNNKGTLYGQDYASFAQELVQLSDSDEYNKYFNKSSQTKIKVTKTLTSLTYPNVQSGNDIPAAYYALVDDEGQVVTTSSGGTISISQVNKTINGFTTSITGVNRFFSAYGVYNVSGLFILAAPKSTQQMKIYIEDAVDLNRPTNQYYLRNAYSVSNVSTYVITADLIVRGCIIGEGLKSSGACYTCPSGTYLLFAPTEPTECKVCPAEKAICNGGSNIGPQPGYWRKNNITDNFIECYVETACLGMSAPIFNPVGDCDEGYYGALCSACMPGYSRSGSYECAKCPDTSINLLRLIGIIILFVVGISLLVRSTISGASKKNTHSVYTKIIMNHLQLLSICAAFKFQWPDQVETFFSSGTSVTSSSDSIVSFDCQMDTRASSSIQRYVFQPETGEMRITYQKLMIFSFMPVLIALLVAAFWLPYLHRKKLLNQFETKYIATLVIIFFLVHPTITKAFIDMYNCQDFDGDLRLMKDLQIVCYKDLHPYIAYGVALPSIIIWGLGIPAAVWILLRKDRERLDTEAVKQKFGFLYNGYKRTNFFWEIVIMYRKVGLVAISVFLNRIGVIVQALVLLLVLVGFLQINNMRRPFANRSLNDIEDLSLMTGIITIYCAIFFITNKDKTSESFNPNTDFALDETGKLILFAIIVIANAAFILTWLIKFISVIRLLLKERYKRIYICLFLCCRTDKYEKENEQLAKIIKRETIIEKIEEVQFFLKNMKGMYTRQIFYEGHQRFLKMLYFIEQEKATISLREKKHNFYIQGKMARDRKFDPERMKEILDERVLSIDQDFGGDKKIEDIQPQSLNTQEKRKSRLLKKLDMTGKSLMTTGKANLLGDLKKLGRAKHIDDQFKQGDGEEVFTKMLGNRLRMLKPQGSGSGGNGSQSFNLANDDLEDTRIGLNQGTDSVLDQTNRLDDSQRLPLFGGINDSMIQNFMMEQPQQKDLKKNDDIAEKILRSRNAQAKLNKQRKKRVYVEDLDILQQRAETEQQQSADVFSERALIKNYYFDSGAENEGDESVKQKRLMRGLTKRLAEGKKNKFKQSLQEQIKIKAAQGSKNRSASSADGKNQYDLSDVSLDFHQQNISKNRFDKGKLKFGSQIGIKEQIQKQESKDQQKMLSTDEIMKMTKMGFAWRNQMNNIKSKLRPNNAVKREIMVDNYCRIKEVNKQMGINQIAQKIKGDKLDVDLADINDGDGYEEEKKIERKDSDNEYEELKY